jgi:hypothetical protein
MASCRAIFSVITGLVGYKAAEIGQTRFPV